MSVFKKSFAIIFIFFCISGFSKAQTLKLGYIEFPPVFSTDKNGKPQGLLIDLAAKVLPEAGYEWEAYSYPVKRMVDYIVRGNLDLWIGLKTIPEFKTTTLKGSSSLLDITLKAYRLGQKPDIIKREDLMNKKIIIIKGFSYGGWVNYIKNPENKVLYTETYEHLAAFKMLKAGRADYVLDYVNPSEKALQKIKIDALFENTISSFSAYFVVSKKTRDAQKVIKNLEKTYQRLKKEGKLQNQ